MIRHVLFDQTHSLQLLLLLLLLLAAKEERVNDQTYSVRSDTFTTTIATATTTTAGSKGRTS